MDMLSYEWTGAQLTAVSAQSNGIDFWVARAISSVPWAALVKEYCGPFVYEGYIVGVNTKII